VNIVKLSGPVALKRARSLLPFLFRSTHRLPVVVAACGAILLSACHQREAVVPEAKPVVALAVHPDANNASASLPAQVQARYSTPLSFRVGGKIIERRVRIGDSVKAGQTVALLDPTDLRNNLANARALLAAAEHRLSFAKQQLDRDQAQAHANLISLYGRARNWAKAEEHYKAVVASGVDVACVRRNGDVSANEEICSVGGTDDADRRWQIRKA